MLINTCGAVIVCLQSETASFSTPLEYSISPQDGNCDFDEQSERVPAVGPLAFLQRVVSKHTVGQSLIRFTPGTRPSGVGQEYLLSFLGNNELMTDAIDRFSRGLLATYTESVSRTYYKAALVPAQLEADSFTQDFKAAVLSLANNVTQSLKQSLNLTLADLAALNVTSPAFNNSRLINAALSFTFDWGNFLVDSAVGALTGRSDEEGGWGRGGTAR